jgi:two-component system response regulator AtoC
MRANTFPGTSDEATNMFTNDKTILVGEAEPEARAYFERALSCLGYSVELASDGEQVLEILNSLPARPAAILLDVLIPGKDGIETLKDIRSRDSRVPVIMLSGVPSPNSIVAAMKCGATDFLCKPVAHEDLQLALQDAMEEGSSASAWPLQTVHPQPAPRLSCSVRNPRVQEIYAQIPDIGRSEAPVLIQGETGCGKEVFARELHANSVRAGKTFLKLNCAALPSELVESELFGYERGAFTGAFQRRAGMFEMANGGTLLLDEIGDMDVRLQAKLLQVLQDHEFQRIGGKEVIKVDIRVLAATHRNLEHAILEGTFREDLYYRINVINIELPPLRERKEDIIPLAEYFLKKHAIPGTPLPIITSTLKAAMLNSPWRGNIRELENVARRFLVLRNPDVLAAGFSEKEARMRSNPAPVSMRSRIEIADASEGRQPPPSVLQQVTKAKQRAEADAILAALDSTRWNRKQAAVLLQIEYKSLLYKLKKLGLEDKGKSFDVAVPEVLRASHGS